MTRAWRRPVDDAEVHDMYTLFEKLRSNEVSFEAAIRETFALVLVSPEFLYIVEPASVDGSDGILPHGGSNSSFLPSLEHHAGR